MKTGKPTLLKTIAGLFVLILVAGGLVLAAQFKRPLGPALGLPTVTASASPVPPSDEEAGASPRRSRSSAPRRSRCAAARR
jgi:hypothetical protein